MKQKHEPQLDPTTSGITFVDILFALAVGLVLAPLAPWAANHFKHSLPAPVMVNLAVALTLILTSFIGYHNSENRPRFKIRFFNIGFFKFFIDISLVIAYFMFAAFASVNPSQTSTLLLIFLAVFLLYLMWDFSGWYEKTKADYKNEWIKQRANTERPDVYQDWTEVDRLRILPTIFGVMAALVMYLWSLHEDTPPPTGDVFVLDAGMLAVLIVYRVFKDNMKARIPRKMRPQVDAPAAGVPTLVTPVAGDPALPDP